MAFFDCQIVQGGASGTGIPLIVTCSEDFAGKIITATDGTTTLTKICPSTSPYTVQFDLVNTGSWTVSGVIEGQTYSETIAVTEYQLSLETGFSFKTWISRGGLDPDDYASLSAVFADEEAVRRLMLVHASADYLIDCVTDDITVIDDFCANDTAMKWLGLCDYVCDGLTAITGVEAKLLASTYWERYLKDHVPVMTSNSTPYGTVTSSSIYSAGYEGYKAFDGDDTSMFIGNTLVQSTTATADVELTYQFTSPTLVKKFLVKYPSARPVTKVIVSGSNDGSNFTPLITVNNPASGTAISIPNDNYYLFVKATITSRTDEAGVYLPQINTVQFYGRQLSVSVPVMTSNTAPFGEAFADSESSASYAAWKAFDGDNNSYASGTSKSEHYWGYVFPSDVKVKMAMIYSSSIPTDHMYIESADSKTGTFSGEEFTVTANANYTYFVDLSNVPENKAIRLRLTKSTSFGGAIGILQFYGVDYSEKEFEAGITKKWLYDHGLELESISEAVTTGGTITFGSNYVNLDRTNGSANLSIATDNTIDLTAYSMLFTIADTTKSSSIERIGVAASRTTGISSMTTSKLVTMVGSNVKDGVDISAVDESQYVIVLANNIGAFNLKEIWVD